MNAMLPPLAAAVRATSQVSGLLGVPQGKNSSGKYKATKLQKQWGKARLIHCVLNQGCLLAAFVFKGWYPENDLEYL